jgi:hypothetical protein
MQLLSDVSGVTGTNNDERRKGSHSGSHSSPPSRFDLCEDESSPNSTHSRDDDHRRTTSTTSQHNYNKFNSSSDRNMSTEVKEVQPASASTEPRRIFNLPQLEQGLANVDPETLRSLAAPIWESLATLDAEELLCLERVDQGGAQVQEG